MIITNCCDAAADLRLSDVDWFRELITDDWLALMENFVQICFFCYIEVKKDALTIYSFICLFNYFFKKNVQKEKK